MYNLVEMDTFGQWLKRHRRNAGLTQEELKQASGVSASYISTLERDQPHSITGAPLRPEPDKVRQLAMALKADIDEALSVAGYATTSPMPDDFIKEGFEGLDEDDIKKIVDFIRFTKSQKQHEP